MKTLHGPIAAAFVAAVLIAAGCDTGGGNSGGVPTVTGVTVSPENATVVKGGTRQFSAVVKGDNEPKQTVTWTVTGGRTTGTNISDAGLLSVAANETATTLTVTAASTADPTKSGAAAVTVAGNEFSIATEEQWNRAVNAIANGGNNREYTINITGDFSIKGEDLSAGTFGAVKGLRVFLRGSKTITLSAGHGPLLVMRENQNLILQGLALKGNSQNYYFVVHIAGGGVIMEEGEISGNSGGGVYIDNGSFIMEEGEISDNSGGSGVFVSSGGFTMKNGKIFGNTASFGGGVNVGNGSFIMEAGEISGNTSKEGGGGVDIYGGGFTMKGGKISNNTAKAGGGVCVFSGSFIMEEGEISGNTSKETGGGVFVETRGALIKTGGVITGWGDDQTAGNKVVDKDRNPISGNGHAVYASGSPAKYLDSTVSGDKNLSSSDASWTE